MMNDWYQRMIDTLQLNGKGERTQRRTRARCACFLSSMTKPPSWFRCRNSKSISCSAKMSIAGPPKPCASAIAGYGFSTRKSSTATGTFSPTARPERIPPPRRPKRRRSPKRFGPRQNLSQPCLSFHRHSCGLRLHEGLHLEVSLNTWPPMSSKSLSPILAS